MKENWTYKKLGEVCDIYQPQTISTEMLVPDGEYLVYGANGVIGRYDKYNHTESEVLLTCRGATCGSINVSAPYSWINGNAMVIHPIDDSVFCSRSFLVYLMKSIDYSLVITGAAQPQITRQKLSPVKIAIPPIETQSRIVSELDLLQSIIDKQKAQLRELDNLAQAVFYYMFGDPVENEKGWDKKMIKEIARVKIGPFGSLIHTSDYVIGGTPIVNPIHMKNGQIYPDNNFTISDEKKKEMESYLLKKGDVVFARRGEIGRCAIVSEKEDGYLCGTGSLFVRFIETINEVFVLYLTKSESFINELVSKAKGATMLNINCGIVEDLQLSIPPISLQQSFAAKIESIEKQKAAISQSIAETQRLFDYTMDKYFG